MPDISISDRKHEIEAVTILGSRVHLLSAKAIVDCMERWIEDGDSRGRRVVVTGFHGLLAANRNPGLKTVLNTADVWAPDGIAPVWIARLRGHRNVQRAPGAEIMQEFLSRANLRGYSSYFYGDTGQTLAALRQRVERTYPGHRVVGTYSPPFRLLSAQEDAEVIERINRVRPDVLWVGLGLPKQDLWIHEHIEQLNVRVAIGVGAAFAFVAGTVPRCPAWMGRLGFEWLYRLLREPRKLWRRDFLDGPQFLMQVALELAGWNRTSGRQ